MINYNSLTDKRLGVSDPSVLITGRNEVLAKVMFLHVSVILLTGGVSAWRGGCLPGGGGVCLEGGFLQILGGGSPPEYGQRSAGTHPTGMHSCYKLQLLTPLILLTLLNTCADISNEKCSARVIW